MKFFIPVLFVQFFALCSFAEISNIETTPQIQGSWKSVNSVVTKNTEISFELNLSQN